MIGVSTYTEAGFDISGDTVRRLSAQLSDLYVRRDECWLTECDPGPIQREIEAIEGRHAGLLRPCHLCDVPTIFHDAAFELPFCWRCLHERYDHWYRSVRYHRGRSRK